MRRAKKIGNEVQRQKPLTPTGATDTLIWAEEENKRKRKEQKERNRERVPKPATKLKLYLKQKQNLSNLLIKYIQEEEIRLS